MEFKCSEDDIIAGVFEFVKERHAGQVDKAGNAYIYHLSSVSHAKMELKFRLVGFLHDILEDTPTSTDELLEFLENLTGNREFSEGIVKSVCILTHSSHDERTYFDYIRDILESGDEVAIGVKIADLQNNLLVERGFYSESLFKRYQKALKILQNDLNEERT